MNDQLRHETTELIKQILNSEFDKNTVKSLLINIRDTLPKKSSLKDICDLIAHPEKAKGLICEKLKHFELYMKFHLEYGSNKKDINTQEMPSYFLDYMNLQSVIPPPQPSPASGGGR